MSRLAPVDLRPPPLTPRTRLFHLPPIGVGTPLVEGLAGYVARLAEAHSVATSSLVGEELLPLMRPPGYETRPTANWLADHGPHFSGTGSRARQAVEALMLLTGRQELQALTLLPWAAVLAPHGLLRLRRPARVWCPACYTDRLHRGEPLYEPLLWSITVVTVCPLHEIPLQTRCPYADCARMLPAIAAWSRPGHCSWCRRPLYRACQERPDGARTEERGWDLWVAQQLGAILAAGGGPAARRCDDRWAGLERLIHARCGKDPGCYGEFARLIGLHANNLRRWRAGCALPTIDVLLRACHRLGIALTDLLSGESAGPPTSTCLVPPDRPCRRQPFAPAAGQTEEFQQRVAAVVAESAVHPLSAAAAARRLGCPSGALARLQPEAYRSLTTRYCAYRRRRHDAWVADLAADTKKIMTRLHGAGIYPAAKLVRPQLRQRIHPRNSDFNRIHHQFLAELGWCVGGTRSPGS